MSCFHCGLTLQNFKGSDCIWTKHFGYNADCIHLLQNAPKYVIEKKLIFVSLEKLRGKQPYCDPHSVKTQCYSTEREVFYFLSLSLSLSDPYLFAKNIASNPFSALQKYNTSYYNRHLSKKEKLCCVSRVCQARS